MTPVNRPWYASVWFPILALIIGAGLIAQPPAGPDRLDFVAAEGQTTFPTSNVSPRPNVTVYRNGLLQRQGTDADYTQQYIQNGARIRITFNPQTAGPVPAIGDYITLFYWRP